MKRGSPDRNWDDIEIDHMTPCLICGIVGRTERAHVLGRRYDQPHPDRPNSKRLWVNPLDIVPLCGPALDTHSCHYRYDHGEIDLLDKLPFEQQVRAVSLAGSIENARMRLAPRDYHRYIVEARREVAEALL